MKVRLLNISIFPPVRECVPQEITQSLAVYSEFFGDFVHRAFLIDHFLDDIFFSGQPDLHGLFAFRTTEFRAFRFFTPSASVRQYSDVLIPHRAAQVLRGYVVKSDCVRFLHLG